MSESIAALRDDVSPTSNSIRSGLDHPERHRGRQDRQILHHRRQAARSRSRARPSAASNTRFSSSYEGHPKKGLYFILPDENYPRQPQEIWTQGEAEDTRNYIPIYDYPNDRLTSEMILTVPASWITISNGKLAGRERPKPTATKTWDWKQSEPLSSYLISAIAGDFVEKDDTLARHAAALRGAARPGI